jgi:multidrug efflux pump subunit AcrA (membrane-fusion protein)
LSNSEADIIQQLTQTTMPTYSESAEDLLTQAPNWLLRSGASVMVGLLALMFVFAYLIRYPEIASATVVLHNANAPANISASINSRFVKINVRHGQTVHKNDTLLVLESSANYEEVFLLDIFLKNLHKPDTLFWQKIQLENYYQLGNLQQDYETLRKKIAEYQLFHRQNAQEKQISALKNEYAHQNKLNEILYQQHILQSEDFKISTHHHQTDSVLASDRTIAPKEWLQTKSAFLSKKSSFEQSKASQIGGYLRSAQLEQNMIDLGIKQQEQAFRHEQDIQTALVTLQKNLFDWKKAHLIQSPFEGVVNFQKMKTLFSEIKAGDELLAVVPNERV